MLISVCLIVILLFTTINTQQSQEQPIPSTYDGLLIYGKQSASAHYFLLEVFYDLLDPDSASSFSLLQSVIKAKNLIHLFPTPNNLNSYPITIGMKYLQDQFGVQLATEYMKLIFNSQSQFWSTSGMSQQAVEKKLSQLVSSQPVFSAKFSQSAFQTALQNGTYDGEVRVGWKYGCSRHVFETPTYFANGIQLNDADGYDQEDWETIFNQFFYS